MALSQLAKRLKAWEQEKLTRTVTSYTRAERGVLTCEQSSYLDFASNDYLSLLCVPEIKQAYIDGIEQFGIGSGASAMVSGFHPCQHALQQAFAIWLGYEGALLMGSGFNANVTILDSIIDKNTLVLIDKSAHASIYDGLRLAGLSFKRYRHCDLKHLNELLKSTQDRPTLVIAESVYSMTGRQVALKPLAQLTKHFNAMLMIDDAHGIGVLGEGGRSVSSILPSDAIDILVCPLGKAFASHGAMVCGSQLIIDGLKQFSRTYRYSTALPPAHAHGLLCTLNYIQKAHAERKQLKQLIAYFRRLAAQTSLSFLDSPSAIQYLSLGNIAMAQDAYLALKRRGILCSFIRTPTVSVKQTGLRIVLHAEQTTASIDALFDCLVTVVAED